jgi:predicted nucleotidyltransferase
VAAALHRLLDSDRSADLCRLDEQGDEALYAERVTDTKMAFADFVTVERQKINQGAYRGRPYFIRFVLTPEEVTERYGERRYTAVGRALVAATVIEASEAIFTPCRYGLADVQTLDGAQIVGLHEIVSYRGRFCEQARVGDRVQVRGLVEKVETEAGAHWYRMLLGNTAEDTLLPWRRA